MIDIRHGRLWLCALICLISAAAGQTTGPIAPCLDCHKPSKTTVDPERYLTSVHAQLPCTTCHTGGFEKFPHTAKRADMPDCIDCHTGQTTPVVFDDVAKEVKASVHAKLVDKDFRCTNCHSPHYFIPASRMGSASEVLSANNSSCLSCHAPGETPSAREVEFKKLVGKHQTLVHAELHLRATACVGCHTPAGTKSVHLILPKEQALRDCNACHSKDSLLIKKLYTQQALKERAERGWINEILFNNAYLTGGTRNKWLDWATVLLAGFLLFFIAAHAAGRLLFARLRRSS